MSAPLLKVDFVKYQMTYFVIVVKRAYTLAHKQPFNRPTHLYQIDLNERVVFVCGSVEVS
ncbi:TPA: hypothetical protein K8105_002539 [Staphylococcus pseudintermedius]|nr:hypothetical protein [Staphylococcus pseudintermedius]